ncbi:MAG: tRNA (adenosine(37)-N6)-threonylcarbamoyltransferase complex dimerization subunit type 1 TsaB [Nitrospirae bacterium]|nr:tRNA (adenosine(37)-N6)-threonylcarbamoyltransferase complex dimerization subunit type 1 TsaB [Nitrospirota bacterium]
MLLLAVESAGPRPGAALATEDGLLDQEIAEPGARPGKHLVPLFEQLLSRRGFGIQSIDLYAVDVGPGSFTGIRVGLASLKALALVHPRPAIAVSSLEAMAWDCPSAEEDVVPVLHSHRDLFYVARFGWKEGQVERRMKDTLVRAAELVAAIAGGGRGVRFVGTGLSRIPPEVRSTLDSVGWADPADGERIPTVSSVAAVAMEHFQMGLGVAPHSLQPAYLQNPY